MGGQRCASGSRLDRVLSRLQITNSHAFFWPIFVVGGWGIGLVVNAWDVYPRGNISEEDFRREERRMAGRS